MKTRSDGESHQDENIIHRGDNPFEQSLYETWGIFSRVESIQYFIMYTLLKELAAHDGLNSPKHQFLLELQEKHVLDDATEVLTIFNLSLLDLDENWSDNNRKNMFVEYEAPKRAEQIAAYNCFHIEKKYPFDELGRLIMLHGVFVLEKWTGNSLTVSFNNGASYILLDSFGEHKIFKAARSCDDLQNQKQQDSKIFIMKQESKVNTFIDYDKLEFSNINLHVIPCCYGDGRWNGKKSPQEEGPWHWHRVFLDFYLNLDNVSWGKSSYGQKVEFDINYEIHHITLDSSIIIASETLHYQQELQNINKNDGLFFRVFTLPFYTDHDTTRSDYQLNLKVISKEKKFITKYAFSVQDKQYELLVLDTMPTNVSGIPLCQRNPSAEPGEDATILMPVTNLPPAEQNGRYKAMINFYLAKNEDYRKGTVYMDSLKIYEMVDSTDTLPPVVSYPENSAYTPKSRIASFIIDEDVPDDYLVYNIEIPKRWSDNTKITRGAYTLVALVTHHNQIISEAVISNLKIK